MYYLAKKDHTITPNERSMLDLQARSYGITEERRVYLEQWYDGMWEKGGSNNDLARKYGKSGINMMGVFSTRARPRSTKAKFWKRSTAWTPTRTT